MEQDKRRKHMSEYWRAYWEHRAKVLAQEAKDFEVEELEAPNPQPKNPRLS